jgi:glycosyltransferase involved in cell wall biosynthesis
VIEDGKTGVLVPPGQPQALGDAILRLLGRSELPSMATAARKRAQEHFDIRRMVADYEALYTTLLTARGQPLGAG